jgi:anti-sigma factor (TIGR02949 family)
LSCELAQTRLHAYLDGELDAAGSSDFNQHLRSCPACAAALGKEEKLRQALQESRLYARAPAGLKLRIQENLPGPRAEKSAGLLSWRWLTVAAALLLAAFLGWRQLTTTNERTYSETAAIAAVDAHLRSLQPGHLVDVQSTDQHTVKPWFNGKLDVSPPVIDLAAQGFTLIGGRLDYVDARAIGAVVYRRRQHVINLFVSQTSSTERRPARIDTIQGFNIRHWSDRGLNYWAVSDLAKDELADFGERFESAIRAAG